MCQQYIFSTTNMVLTHDIQSGIEGILYIARIKMLGIGA